jgi:hypothetical protein
LGKLIFTHYDLDDHIAAMSDPQNGVHGTSIYDGTNMKAILKEI